MTLDVIHGSAPWSCDQADAIDWLGQLPADSVDCLISSPPYCDARTYGIAAQRKCVEWVEWMLEVSVAAQRVVKGPMFWVVAGVTRKRNYWPAPEGLSWEWWRCGGECQLYRPCVFHRHGIPGSGGVDYFRADWEMVICMKHPGKLPWSDNTACGHPPKWAPGGEMSYRLTDGQRRNEWGGTDNKTGMQGRYANGKHKNPARKRRLGRNMANGVPGSTKGSCIGRRVPRGHQLDGQILTEDVYQPPVLANPGNVFSGKVGGGHMGSPLAHEGEAPYPEWLVEPFVRSFCPPGGIVCDPFIGTGTTAAVAVRWRRRFIGCDVRRSQVDLTARRLAGVAPLET